MLSRSLLRGARLTVPRALALPAKSALRCTSSALNTNFKTLVEMQLSSCEINAKRELFGVKKGEAYHWYTYGQFAEMVSHMRTALALQGIKKDDKVAIISNNRLEWAVTAYASYSLGAQFVPMYEAQLEKDWQYILQDSDAKLLMVSTEKIYEQTKQYPGKLGSIQQVFCMDAPESDTHSYQALYNKGKTTVVDPFLPVADDIATIIYTSGTTGKPKGVELTHKNICAVIYGIKSIFPSDFLDMNVRAIAFLPWAHVYGQTCDLHALMSHGSSMGIVSDVTQVVPALALIKPSLIQAVPLMYKRIYDKVHATMQQSSPLKQRLFNEALSVSRRRNELLDQGKSIPVGMSLQHMVYDKVVFSKIRQVLGGNVKYAMSGGASAPLEVLQFMEDIGVPMQEGYGLSETAPLITVNSTERDKRYLGTVGVPIGGVEVKIVDPETLGDMPDGEEGEIIVHGPVVMKGYHNKPEETAKVFVNLNGKKYFRTGDRGKMVESKFLKVTGRIKEQFKLENGKYVVPVPLEELMCKSVYVAQSYVSGANKEHTIALISPDIVNLSEWCVKHGVLKSGEQWTSEMLKDPRVIEFYTQELETAFQQMKRYERPRRWALITEPFSVDNQSLTPKMSLRRHNIEVHYKAIIDNIYAGTEGQESANTPSGDRTVGEQAASA